MPKYIGYRPTTTASSVTNSLGNVDTKYNSGIWSIRDIYSKRSKGSWPTTTRGAPVEPFTDDANTLLLLHMDGNNGSTTFTDSSSNGFSVITNGAAQITTSSPKYGSGAYLGAGDGDYIWINDPAALEFSGAWTLEGWFLANDDDTTLGGIFSRGLTGNGNAVYFLRKDPDGTFAWGVSTNGTTYDLANRSGVGAYVAGVWTKIALVFNGSSYRLLIDGSTVDTVTSSTGIYTGGNGNHVIASMPLSLSLVGKMDEVRFSDVARY